MDATAAETGTGRGGGTGSAVAIGDDAATVAEGSKATSGAGGGTLVLPRRWTSSSAMRSLNFCKVVCRVLIFRACAIERTSGRSSATSAKKTEQVTTDSIRAVTFALRNSDYKKLGDHAEAPS